MPSASNSRRTANCIQRKVEELERRNRELERTLQLVEESRSNYADQYDFAPTGVVTFDDKGCIREINLTAAKMLGRERSRMLKMPFLSYVAKPSFPTFLDHLRQCRIARTKVTNDIGLSISDRRVLHVELRSVPVLDIRRGDTVYRTAVTDITERLHAEERFSKTFHASTVAIAITTLASGRFIDVNEAFLHLVGLSRENVIGRTAGEIGLDEGLDERREIVRDLRDQHLVRGVEGRIMSATGGSRDVLTSRELIELAGEKCLLSIIQDVSERKRLERQVLAISEWEQARIGRDLHDGLCQSLIGIACFADVLKKKFCGDNPRAAAAAQEITVLLKECIEEARDLAAGLYPVRLEKKGITSALRELANEVTQRSHISCVFESDENIVIADPSVAINLYRIVQEAISNAIKHGDAKSVIIRLALENGKTTLTLKDDGKGFPAEFKATGMGLDTMKYRAAMIGGLLEVRRNGRQGTVVACSFPTNGEKR